MLKDPLKEDDDDEEEEEEEEEEEDITIPKRSTIFLKKA